VIHSPARGARESMESSDLIRHGRIDFRGWHRHFSAAKIFAIGKTRMRPERHPALKPRLDRREDRRVTASVKTASNVRGADQIENLFIMSRAFSEIGIEIDDEIHDMCRLKPTRNR